MSVHFSGSSVPTTPRSESPDTASMQGSSPVTSEPVGLITSRFYGASYEIPVTCPRYSHAITLPASIFHHQSAQQKIQEIASSGRTLRLTGYGLTSRLGAHHPLLHPISIFRKAASCLLSVFDGDKKVTTKLKACQSFLGVLEASCDVDIFKSLDVRWRAGIKNYSDTDTHQEPFLTTLEGIWNQFHEDSSLADLKAIATRQLRDYIDKKYGFFAFVHTHKDRAQALLTAVQACTGIEQALKILDSQILLFNAYDESAKEFPLLLNEVGVALTDLSNVRMACSDDDLLQYRLEALTVFRGLVAQFLDDESSEEKLEGAYAGHMRFV